MANKYLDSNGLLYLWSKIKAVLPKKTSELTNDSGYITSADIPEGAAASTTTPKMNGTAAVGTDTGFARGDHVHPTDTSRASASTVSSHTSNTTMHITPAERTAWNAKLDKQTTLAGYGITDAYTKTQVDGLVSGALHYKGSKNNYSDLPSYDNVTGDVWNIANADATHGVKAGDNVAWNGESWDVLSGTVDLSSYMLTSDMVAVTNGEIDTIVAT